MALMIEPKVDLIGTKGCVVSDIVILYYSRAQQASQKKGLNPKAIIQIEIFEIINGSKSFRYFMRRNPPNEAYRKRKIKLTINKT